MLLTDAPFVCLSDLLKLESEVQDVADAQNISLTLTIDDTLQEITSKLVAKGMRFEGRTQPVFMPAEYGVQSLYTESGERPRYSIAQVVTTDGDYPMIWTALKRWAVAETLYNFYRNAARRMRSEDRYAEARDEYKEEVRNKYYPRFEQEGCPIVGLPLACPGAYWEQTAGTWSASNITPIPGSADSVAEPSIDIAITYSASSQTSNNESGPTPVLSTQLTAGQQVSLSIASLNPPTGKYRQAAVARLAINGLTATNWNVYAAVTGSPLTLQRTLPVSTKTMTLDPAALINNGAAIGMGQAADLYFTLMDTVRRG